MNYPNIYFEEKKDEQAIQGSNQQNKAKKIKSSSSARLNVLSEQVDDSYGSYIEGSDLGKSLRDGVNSIEDLDALISNLKEKKAQEKLTEEDVHQLKRLQKIKSQRQFREKTKRAKNQHKHLENSVW